jgi:hypothetical protein
MRSPSRRVESEGVVMTSISILLPARLPSGHAPGRMPAKRLGAIVALWAALAACPAPAQEGAANGANAPAASADVPQAGGSPGDSPAKGAAAAPDKAATSNRGDVEPVTPMHGAASLQRRANMKALIANALPKHPGAPAGTTRVGPLPARPVVEAAAVRNAIGVQMPGAKSPGHDGAGVATQPRVTGIGTTLGSAGSATRPMPVPTNAGAALRGVGVNGTAMGRVASGPALVGGPARDRSGINGTVMRPRF